MVQDDLDKRASDEPLTTASYIGRPVEVMAVGVAWSVPGMLLGLLAAVLMSAWPDVTVWFGLSGTVLGGVVGLWLESVPGAPDLPTV
jgi:hypothetical protein